MISIRETLIVIKKIFPFFLLFIGKTMNSQVLPDKKIWVYIKANKLQDPKNRRMINADAKLKVVFGGKAQVSMFDMAKHLAKHLS